METLENQWSCFTPLQCDLHKNVCQSLSDFLATKEVQNLATKASIFPQIIRRLREFHICQLLHKSRQKNRHAALIFQLRKVVRKINVARKLHVKKSCNKEIVVSTPPPAPRRRLHPPTSAPARRAAHAVHGAGASPSRRAMHSWSATTELSRSSNIIF